MRCRFLEISAASENVLASLQYYRALGFVELRSGDVLGHPYAVVSDGRVNVGLHARELPSPALSFVLPGLADALDLSPSAHLEAAYLRTGDEQFHEAGFEDPGGQAVIMLEARTFSPPDVPDTGTSLLGYFEGYSLPCINIDASVACWEDLGFVAIEEREQPHRQVTLTSENLNLLLHQDARLREPALLFSGDKLEARIALLRQRSFELERDLQTGNGPTAGALLRSPEGLLLRLIPE